MSVNDTSQPVGNGCSLFVVWFVFAVAGGVLTRTVVAEVVVTLGVSACEGAVAWFVERFSVEVDVVWFVCWIKNSIMRNTNFTFFYL